VCCLKVSFVDVLVFPNKMADISIVDRNMMTIKYDEGLVTT